MELQGFGDNKIKEYYIHLIRVSEREEREKGEQRSI